MNGAEILVKTAVKAGIALCLSNPGTTEMPIVEAFDSVSGIHSSLCLFEGVCTGMADGYGRLTNKPAMTLLHLGPGFANGLANAHNAKRARTPMINIIGDHDTWHKPADAPLNMDIEALAKTVSGFVCSCKSTEEISHNLVNAIDASLHGQVATLIIPHNYLISESKNNEISLPNYSLNPVDKNSIEEAYKILTNYKNTAIIMGGKSLRKDGLKAAARIKEATNCDLLVETWPSYMDRGVALPILQRIPYAADQAISMLSKYDAFVLVDAKEPVAFFGFNNNGSYFLNSHQKKIVIGSNNQDPIKSIESLADFLDAPKNVYENTEILKPEIPTGNLTVPKTCAMLAATQPENSIIVDEGITAGFAYFPLANSVLQHSLITIVGGAIGYGIPCSAGVAMAAPDRPVINFQADGSAMYTVQGLWTQARESLNVTTLICSNRTYEILRLEQIRAGKQNYGENVKTLTDLSHPKIDWPKLSQGLGVPGVSVTTCEELQKELIKAQNEYGPRLIEIIL